MIEDTEHTTFNENGEEEKGLIPVALPLDMGAVEVALYPLGRNLKSKDFEEVE